jgi:methylenetetrahydrofolate dehydrogenase (NADP+)/methenyltetrahydrofolate cyclohydrolase
MIVIDGQAIATAIEQDIKLELARHDLHLVLASLFIGEAADSKLYIKRKAEAAKRLGVEFTVEHLSADTLSRIVEEKIYEMNKRPALDGYIIQLPLPASLRLETDRLLNLIEPKRDVDGLTEANRRKLFQKERSAFLPTPLYAVLTVLASLFPETHWQDQLQFRTGRLPQLVPAALKNELAVIISDGSVFGSTLKWALEDGGMQAVVERSDSPTLLSRLPSARLIVSAVGKPEFITGDMLPAGTIIIDVGTTLVRGKTVGDVRWSSLNRHVAAATPVPGGVGPVTVAMLYANLLYLKLRPSYEKGTITAPDKAGAGS